MSDFGVVATVSAPLLKGVTQAEVIKFDLEYDAYKDKVADINRSRDSARRITPATMKHCIDPVLLQSLCLLGQIENAENASQATDAKERRDPSGAALRFVVDVVSALDQNNASEVLDDKDVCKSLIGKLLNKLEPPELRERIRAARECWTADQRSSLKYFQSRVSTTAVEVAQGEIARTRIGKKGGGRNNFPKTMGTLPMKRGLRPENSGEKRPKQDNKRRAGNSTWSDPCLNPNCRKLHRLNDCKDTSPELKKKLFEAYHAKKKTAPSAADGAVIFFAAKKVSIPTKDFSTSPNAAEGRYTILLEDNVPAVGNGDYGSDESALPRALFDKLLEHDPTLPHEDFEPFPLSAAIKGTSLHPIHFSTSRKTSLSITIMLPKTNLPVRVHGVPFYVIDEDMDEVLLGRPFLKRIGFDLEEHLERVGPLLHEKTFEELRDPETKGSIGRFASLRYNAIEDDPIAEKDACFANMGLDPPEEIDAAFQKILSDAISNGVTTDGSTRIRKFLAEFKDIFRIRLGPDQPAKVDPLSIRPKANARPFRAPQRRYSPTQRAFISNTIEKLEKVGAVYRNPTARWASPALAVPKPGTEGFRFTVDLRGPNAQTEPIASSMPHLESQLQDVQGSTCFAKIDMSHAYWQIPLAKDSQEMMSIQTPRGVYSSTRLLQGSTDAGNHYQAVTDAAFQHRTQNILQWLDDFLLHATSETLLLRQLREFFLVCREYNFKIHALKTHLFLREAKFCGRVLSADGVRFDPRCFDSILHMHTPTTGGDLQQLLCAANWMRTAIPSYSSLIAPLHSLLESVYTQAGSRTKRAVTKISLAALWGTDHASAFANLKQQLARSTKQSLPKENFNLCLFTDASDTHWSAVLTQIPHDETKTVIENQDHEPLAFLSGAFTGSAEGWSVPEKEGFAVVEAMCRLDYIVIGKQVTIFTDHANLVYLFNPYGQNPGIARHTANKLMRWALKLSSFRYVIEHLAGERNVWADMLTR